MKRSNRSFFARLAPLILFLFAAGTPLLMYAAYRAVRSNTNKVADWLPKTFVETKELRWFRQHFRGDQYILVSWDGCRLGGDPRKPGAEPDDPRIERLAQMLVPVDAPAAERETRYFHSVITGRRLLDQLTSPPMDLPYDLAVQRLQGLLIGPDGHQTGLLVTLTDAAISDLRAVIGRASGGWLRMRHPEGVLFQALRACEIDLDRVHLGGPPVDNVAIDQEGEQTMLRLAGLAGLLGLTLAWWSLRSVRLTLMVFACGLLSASAGLAAVWLSGETTDAVVLSMPSLVYVLAISGAVHLINYYRDAVDEGGPERAAERAVAHGWKPALLCSVTTAFGLLSLCTSDLTPIRKFGIYAALAVMLMLVVLFVFLPAALQVWGTGREGRRRITKTTGSRTLADDRQFAANANALDQFWQRFGRGIIQKRVSVTVACAALMILAAFGLTRVRTSVDLMKLFDDQAAVVRDYRWLETHLGRLVPMEIVLRFDPDAPSSSATAAETDNKYSLVERMKIVREVQQTIENRFGPAGQDVIGPTLSAVTFLPPLPEPQRGLSGVIRRQVARSKLDGSYQALRESGYLTIDRNDGAELWRISLRVAAFQGVDYGRLAEEIRHLVDPLLADAAFAQPQGSGVDSPLTAVYTGIVPIVYKTQRALLDNLISSTFWSFATITPLLMLVSRGVRSGIVAMLPNVLPVLFIFGGMGWLRMPVDIGSMMSASIALGVAVDDTIHYLTWFRHGLDRSGDRHTAILAAYRSCATPTLQAALINGLGLAVFAFSTFTPTRQFGYLMLAILLAGAVAELVLLPALLAGRAGQVFEPRRRASAPGRLPWRRALRSAAGLSPQRGEL